MSIVQNQNPSAASVIEQVLVMGDLARLTPDQRSVYYRSVCESLGLNHLTRPFEYITLNGKLTLYARKDATDQLRKLHGVSVRIADRSVMDDLMVVTAEATDRTGRTDSSIGAVSIAGLRGESKANALMKAETKARRRVTLALCGLGMLDESEIDSIPNARTGEPGGSVADRVIANQVPALPPPYQHAVVETVKPIASAVERAVEPAPEPTPQSIANGDSGFSVFDVASIEEHKGKNGPIWKVTTDAGDVFAVIDEMVVSDLSDIRAEGRAVRVEWQKRGQRRIILSAVGVAE